MKNNDAFETLKTLADPRSGNAYATYSYLEDIKDTYTPKLQNAFKESAGSLSLDEVLDIYKDMLERADDFGKRGHIFVKSLEETKKFIEDTYNGGEEGIKKIHSEHYRNSKPPKHLRNIWPEQKPEKKWSNGLLNKVKEFISSSIPAPTRQAQQCQQQQCDAGNSETAEKYEP